MKRICKDCGREFVLAHGEIVFYRENKLNLPARCKPCRVKNQKYGGRLEDVMKHSTPGRGFNKGLHINRSGSNWQHIPDEYIPNDYPSSACEDEYVFGLEDLEKVSRFLEDKANHLGQSKKPSQFADIKPAPVKDSQVSLSCCDCQHRKGGRCTELSNIPCSDFIAIPPETQEQKNKRLGIDSLGGLSSSEMVLFNPEYYARSNGYDSFSHRDFTSCNNQPSPKAVGGYYTSVFKEKCVQENSCIVKAHENKESVVKTCYTCWVRVAGGCAGRSNVCKDYFEYSKK